MDFVFVRNVVRFKAKEESEMCFDRVYTRFIEKIIGFKCEEITKELDALAGKDKSDDYNEAIADAINVIIDMYRKQKQKGE